ncbi:HIT domain-containing protein [Falsirhodobacter algicola]|uniref:HIT domain-containing protein n=1 Tax=Falsirhodobacter algicola TaxID=2692330 RepID=A0A8J8SLW3_9RHOB|nr:HIT domain-containing protein [Falsirhodobacter algicola]QUS36973.1 HIT domain-containing protein [Falsirhodobacter algicola]
MTMTYDPTNIFARILRGEIPNKTVAESAHTLAFEDIAPHAPHHVLVIPKGAYTDFADFAARAPAEEMLDFHRTAARICEGFPEGYRVITNARGHGGQEVPHYHIHILAGRPLGPMLTRQ